MTDTIRVISLWQPYASLIFERRLKRHETRGWKLPAHIVGERVAVHAAKKRPARSFEASPIGQLCARNFGADWRDELPYGAIVGTVVLGACYPTERGPATQADFLSGDWTPGRFAWRLDDPEPIAEPVTMPGRQGWWRARRSDLRI